MISGPSCRVWTWRSHTNEHNQSNAAKCKGNTAISQILGYKASPSFQLPTHTFQPHRAIFAHFSLNCRPASNEWTGSSKQFPGSSHAVLAVTVGSVKWPYFYGATHRLGFRRKMKEKNRSHGSCCSRQITSDPFPISDPFSRIHSIRDFCWLHDHVE